jgi:short-subunit dehydrogenase
MATMITGASAGLGAEFARQFAAQAMIWFWLPGANRR